MDELGEFIIYCQQNEFMLYTIAGVGILYIVPSIIAFLAQKKNSGAILALNLLLGWTLIGWVISLVWSLCNDEHKEEK